MGQKFKEYWDRLCRATPRLNDPATKMTISVASFQKQLAKAFEEGRKHPVTSRKDAADDFANFGKKRLDLSDIFGDMLGGGRST